MQCFSILYTRNIQENEYFLYTSVIADFKGFTFTKNNRFICKEFAVLNLNTNECKSGIFKQPFGYASLSETSKKHIQLQEKNNHNIRWSSGNIMYSKRKEILQDIINNFNSSRVYVWGEKIKIWLQNIINCNVINLEPLLQLQELQINTNYYDYNTNCVLQNVINLAALYRLRFNTYNAIKLFYNRFESLYNMCNEDIELLPMELIMVYGSTDIDSNWDKFPMHWQNNKIFQTYRKCRNHVEPMENNQTEDNWDANWKQEYILIKNCSECNKMY